MTTQALDVASVFYALDRLEKNCIGSLRLWDSETTEQARFFILYGESRRNLEALSGIKASFSVAGSPPLVRVNVETVLDKFVRWVGGVAPKETIYVGEKIYPAFLIKHFETHSVKGFEHPLVVIHTQTGDQLWILMHEEPIGGMDLVELAWKVTTGPKKYSWSGHYEGVIVPKIDFALEPDLGFLAGARAPIPGGYVKISQATQDFKFRMNEEGARAIVHTRIRTMIVTARLPRHLKIDKPFCGWFVQRDVPIPLAVFGADYDSWKEPKGSLKELAGEPLSAGSRRPVRIG
ncbi:MAG: hypothetical protein Q7S03_00575 [bacterium]|nr:hypothetical protein [bacterium]